MSKAMRDARAAIIGDSVDRAMAEARGPMRVLSVRQPWAWAIIHGGKDVENRSRSLGPYRGPVAIHASLTFDYDARLNLRAAVDIPDLSGLEMGAIVGVVDLIDSHETEWNPLCSPWAEAGAEHLVMRNPRALSAPLPFKGGLGLRTLPAGVEAELLRRLA